MKVWIAKYDINSDEEYHSIGVFSSRKLADKACSDHNSKYYDECAGCSYIVTDHDLNKMAR